MLAATMEPSAGSINPVAPIQPSEDLEDDQEDWSAVFFEDVAEQKPKSYNSPHDPFLSPTVSHSTPRGHDRVIIHIDMDCFYAQVEMIENPSLRDKPVGVQQKNLVVTTNYVARGLGVKKYCSVQEALRACPQLILVKGEDLTKYRKMSYKITEFLRKYTHLVERLGFDENYLDVTEVIRRAPWCHLQCKTVNGHNYAAEPNVPCPCGCHQRLLTASYLASEIRTQLYDSLGVTSCAGVAHNKLLAKLVSGSHKPNQQTTIFIHQVEALMMQLGGVQKIPGIGSSMAKKLESLKVSSVPDLQASNLHTLSKVFSPDQVRWLKKVALGEDDQAVQPSKPQQSMSEEDSLRCCDSLTAAAPLMENMILSLLQRVLEDGRTPQVLRVSVRSYSMEDSKRASKQCPVPSGLLRGFNQGSLAAVQAVLLDLAGKLLAQLMDFDNPSSLTVINICLTKFAEAPSVSRSIAKFFQGTTEVNESQPPDPSPRMATTLRHPGKGGHMGRMIQDSVSPGIQTTSEHSNKRDHSGKMIQNPVSPGILTRLGHSSKRDHSGKMIQNPVSPGIFAGLGHSSKRDHSGKMIQNPVSPGILTGPGHSSKRDHSKKMIQNTFLNCFRRINDTSEHGHRSTQKSSDVNNKSFHHCGNDQDDMMDIQHSSNPAKRQCTNYSDTMMQGTRHREFVSDTTAITHLSPTPPGEASEPLPNSMLPLGLDPSVFCQMPRDILQDILSEHSCKHTDKGHSPEVPGLTSGTSDQGQGPEVPGRTSQTSDQGQGPEVPGRTSDQGHGPEVPGQTSRVLYSLAHDENLVHLPGTVKTYDVCQASSSHPEPDIYGEDLACIDSDKESRDIANIGNNSNHAQNELQAHRIFSMNSATQCKIGHCTAPEQADTHQEAPPGGQEGRAHVAPPGGLDEEHSCPPDVDMSVFVMLPKDIQAELWSQWKNNQKLSQRHQSKSHLKTKNNRKGPMEKYLQTTNKK